MVSAVIGSLDLLNVYQGSKVRTVFVGMTRVTTIVILGLAVFLVAPRMYLDPESPTWMVPVVVVGGAIPLVAMSLLSAPFVSTIRVLLPSSAKKNTEALHRFAENVPSDTRIMLQSMRWLPWPTHREMFFGDLRRLPGSKLSVNLEHLPLGHDQARRAGQTFGERFVMRMYGRYWVDMTTRNKSQAPGVWEKMWDQITIKGQEPLKVALKDKIPPTMANRSTQAAATRRAPPPPKAKAAKSRR